MKINKKIILREGRDFVTLASLSEELNRRFGAKQSGEQFSVADADGYTRRGCLPKYLGHNEIVEVANTRIGLRYYMVVGW